jgi:hypothetical protein
MGLLADKKVAVVLALIVMILGSIVYFVVNTSDTKAEIDSENTLLIISTPLNTAETVQENTTEGTLITEGMPIINNEALV